MDCKLHIVYNIQYRVLRTRFQRESEADYNDSTHFTLFHFILSPISHYYIIYYCRICRNNGDCVCSLFMRWNDS